MLIAKLVNGENISQELVVREVPITREVVREVIREVPVPISISSFDDDSKIEYYRKMAVDLNNRVAVCILINIISNFNFFFVCFVFVLFLFFII